MFIRDDNGIVFQSISSQPTVRGTCKFVRSRSVKLSVCLHPIGHPRVGSGNLGINLGESMLRELAYPLYQRRWLDYLCAYGIDYQ